MAQYGMRDPTEAARYFFGNAMACAATHCHSPFRSTHVSVKR
jgi:hypothetical protein